MGGGEILTVIHAHNANEYPEYKCKDYDGEQLIVVINQDNPSCIVRFCLFPGTRIIFLGDRINVQYPAKMYSDGKGRTMYTVLHALSSSPNVKQVLSNDKMTQLFAMIGGALHKEQSKNIDTDKLPRNIRYQKMKLYNRNERRMHEALYSFIKSEIYANPVVDTDMISGWVFMLHIACRDISEEERTAFAKRVWLVRRHVLRDTIKE